MSEGMDFDFCVMGRQFTDKFLNNEKPKESERRCAVIASYDRCVILRKAVVGLCRLNAWVISVIPWFAIGMIGGTVLFLRDQFEVQNGVDPAQTLSQTQSPYLKLDTFCCIV